LFASTALLLGRKTYEGFAAVWHTVKDEAGFADRINSLLRLVDCSTFGSGIVLLRYTTKYPPEN